MPATSPKSSARFLQNARWLVGAFGFLVFLIGWVVPLDFGPDEPYHLEYIHTIAFERRLPTPKESHLIQHPPLYYGVMALAWRLAGANARPLSVTPGPAAMQQTNAASQRARRILRVFQCALAVLSLWLMAHILHCFRVPSTVGLGWLAGIALWPMFGSISAVVNNENAAILFSCAMCLLLVRQTLKGHSTSSDAFLLGLLCGAGVLVKQTTMFVLPIALWCVWSTSKPLAKRTKNVAFFFAATLVLGIWWPLRNHLVSGTPFPSYTMPHDQFALPMSEKLLETPGTLRLILETSFLPDWASRYLPREVSGIAVLFLIAALGAWFWVGWRNPRPAEHGQERQIFQRLQGMSLLAIAALIFGVLQYIWFRDYAAQIGGRYLLSGLPWLCTFLGTGWNLALRKSAPQKHVSRAEEISDLDEASPPPLTLPISVAAAMVLLLIAAGWWLIAWTQYQALIASAVS